ncbi:DUF3466 family protein [Vibrio alfacsensis]|uniref:DUF3466 family protein n=1 Tax=Vibrio alfacsensis TaxID=1074311 RepID=UPI001BEF8210|nr:DUF3466 family protein [Vibrio alfacsensis]BCN24198.1 hypothetical protein VYA_13900 [Vibrio alfacsensis]
MSCKNKFKLTAVALMVGTAMNANAALYNVYEISSPLGDIETHGVAIAASKDGETCWKSDCNANVDQYPMGLETRQYGAAGFDYRSETPFNIGRGFDYLTDGRDGFEFYCDVFLDYNDTYCDESWTRREYDLGYSRELNGQLDNSLAYVVPELEGFESKSTNTVITQITQDGSVTGNYNHEEIRNVAFTTGLPLLEKQELESKNRTQAFGRVELDNAVYVAGSISTEISSEPGFRSSQAAFWKFDKSDPNAEPQNGIYNWNGGSGYDGGRTSNASMRDIAVLGDKIFGVGYNADKDEYPRATVFVVPTDNSEDLTFYSLSWPRTDQDNYENSILYAINENKIAVGTAKYYTGTGFNRAYPNQLFYVKDVESDREAHFVSEGILFDGANTKVGSINNFNELVGTTDFDSRPEIDSTPRRQSAFITTLAADSLDDGGKRYEELYGSQPRFLDDLTNGDAVTDNNQYRIIEASDINDAGVISATALKCQSGYNSTAHNAKCGDGSSGLEKIVAVKLIPIQGATADNIQPRGMESESVDRQGAGLGLWALTLLGLLGFRRK